MLTQKTGCKILKAWRESDGSYRVLYDGGSSFLHLPRFRNIEEMKHGLLLTNQEIEEIKEKMIK